MEHPPSPDPSQGARHVHQGDHIDFPYGTFHAPVVGKLVVQLPPRPAPLALNAVPAPPGGFVGRDSELARLLERLDPAGGEHGGTAGSGAVVVSALAGMGGVGKSALAFKAAQLALDAGWFCAHLFVDLHGYTPGTVPLTGSAGLDVLLLQAGVDPEDIPVEVGQRTAFYRSALQALSQADERGRPVLVVADNAHHSDQILPLLPGPGRHRLVATTRRGLSSLTRAAAHCMDLDVLAPETAIALLATALQASDPQDARANDHQALCHLAELCGGLPLALEITAAHLAYDKELPPSELAERLKRAASRVEELTDPEQHDDQETVRSRVLRAVFDTSLDHLDPEQRRVFLLVAPAPGPTISTASAAVLADLPQEQARKVLLSLANAHLLTRPAQGRWGAHDLLADHAATHPCPPRDRAQALTRLLDHYAITTGAALRSLRAPQGERGSDREVALGWFNSEWPALVAASLIAPALGDDRGAVHLPLFLGEYLFGERLLKEGEQVTRSAQRAARALGDQGSEAAAWNSLGILLQERGRFEDAVEAHTNARDLNQQVGDTGGEAAAWNNLGNALRGVGRFEEAIEAHTRALGLHQQVDNASGEAAAWDNLGSALSEVGRFDEAIDAQIRARDIYHRLGDIRGEARSWGNFGNTLRKAGQTEGMLEAYTRTRDLHRQAGDAHGEAKAWKNLGFALLASGRAEQAVEAFTEAVVLFEATRDEDRAAGVRELIARIRPSADPLGR